ncbi:hypothetical protein [Nannocystis sp. SCPEA4]|uniref:hypothetical protein n=1 Tax=Nannocystis sp. SCPEA4 TaxID=2996787 RepID=UPI00226F2BA4|nr:hypothetical protein [Nannocystis sp. SCPEA4]MCY1062765.1 hypothetical protein [Nannocystis sp. SCPEA4]
MMHRSTLIVGMIGLLACESARKEATTCVEQLAPLREELAWADEATVSSVPARDRLASVPQWQRTTVPEHVVGVWQGEVGVDGTTVTWLSRDDDDDPPWLVLENERDRQREVNASLTKPLASLGSTTVALAVDRDAPWVFVRPVVRTLAERDGAVRLLVAMPAPPWWDARLSDEVAQGTNGLGEVAGKLSARAAEVFADCPAAAQLDLSSSGMIGYVDAIQACDCRVDLARTRELLHAIALPMIAPLGVVEVAVITRGEGAPFEAEPDTPWSAVLPRLLAERTPVLLRERPIPEVPPPPPPPPK